MENVLQPESKPKAPHIRRGRPKAEVVASLRRMRKKDWEALVSATVFAQVNHEYSIFVSFSYLVKLPENFPVGKKISKEGLVDVWKFRTKTMMKWLIEQGHTTLSMYDIQQAGRKFTLEQKEVDRMFSEEYYEDLEEPIEQFEGGCNERLD